MLLPPDGRLHVVRWIRNDGQAAQQRFFRRRADAMVFCAKLALFGKHTTTYVAHVTWQPAGEPDAVDFRLAKDRIRRAETRRREGSRHRHDATPGGGE